MRIGSVIGWLALALLGGVRPGALHAALTAQNLRCEYLVNPLGIDTPQPRLSWSLEAEARGQRQSAYRVRVASTAEQLRRGTADLWDSGKVASAQSLHIPYGGPALRAGQRCFWQVHVWDQADRPAPESELAWWEMGHWPWEARWIAGAGPAKTSPCLRRVFRVEKSVRQARLYLTSLGYHQAYLNGQPVSDHVLDPIQSDFRRRVYYVTHDVTRLLRPGPNALAVALGRGWYWPGVAGVTQDGPALLAELHLEFTDGTRQRVLTDDTWKAAPGPVTPFGHFPYGEIYDARKEQPGWTTAAFADASWTAAELPSLPPVQLSAQMAPPNRILESFPPVSVQAISPNECLFDFGRNLTGGFQLPIRGERNDEIQLSYFASHLGNHQPLTEQMNQADRYLCRGGTNEVFRSTFNYRAFRYVKVTGLRQPPQRADAVAQLIGTDTPPMSRFTCSNPLLNQLHALVTHTHRCLTLGAVQVDCPHRERLGYGAEGQASLEAALYNFDAGAFYTKWIRDFRDGQDPQTGLVYYTAPFRIHSGGGPAWSGASILYPWHLYLYYGDRQILATQYPSMKQWLGFLETRTQEGLLTYYTVPTDLGDSIWNFLGDWASPRRPEDTLPCSGHWPSPTANRLFNNCHYYLQLARVAQIADMLGHPHEAARYRERAAALRETINRHFFDPQTARYSPHEQQQASLALPLLLDLPPRAHQARVRQNLVADIVDRRQGHLDTGVLGSYYLLGALLKEDRSDLIYRLTTQRTWPGWGYLVDQGATTLWEHWLPGDSSLHNSFLSIGAWLFQGPGGIRPDPEHPGFAHIIIRPEPVPELTYARADYQSARGWIRSHWRREAGTFQLAVRLPANTTATVYLPTPRSEEVRESGQPAAQAEGVKFLRVENNRSLFRVASGQYAFETTSDE